MDVATVKSVPVLPELSVVLPCYNERLSIVEVVREAERAARGVARDVELVVVDDGSVDGSAEILRALEKEISSLKVVFHDVNRGYGSALRSGFDAVMKEHVFYTDSDGQFGFEQLEEAARLLEGYDVVIGYRAQRRDPWLRRLNGRLWTSLTNLCFGLQVRDVNCAFKLMPRALVRNAGLRSRGALIDAELLHEARRRDFSVAQIPVAHRQREEGAATGANLRVMLRAFTELVSVGLARR